MVDGSPVRRVVRKCSATRRGGGPCYGRGCPCGRGSLAERVHARRRSLPGEAVDRRLRVGEWEGCSARPQDDRAARGELREEKPGSGDGVRALTRDRGEG